MNFREKCSKIKNYYFKDSSRIIWSRDNKEKDRLVNSSRKAILTTLYYTLSEFLVVSF